MATVAETTEKVSGISKKLAKELEDLPLQTHAAVVEILGVLLKHRHANLQMLQQEAQQEIQQRQMDMAMAEQKRQADARAIKESGLVLA